MLDNALLRADQRLIANLYAQVAASDHDCF